jgi:hypothetical protein
MALAIRWPDLAAGILLILDGDFLALPQRLLHGFAVVNRDGSVFYSRIVTRGFALADLPALSFSHLVSFEFRPCHDLVVLSRRATSFP